MAKSKFPDDLLAEMAAMRERGLSFKRIQQLIKAKHGVTISEGAISWQCLRLGADSPKLSAKVLPQTRPGPVVVMRGGQQMRAFLPEEDEILREQANKTSYSDLARRLGRRRNSISARLMILARQDERRERANAAEAQHG